MRLYRQRQKMEKHPDRWIKALGKWRFHIFFSNLTKERMNKYCNFIDNLEEIKQRGKDVQTG